MAQQWYVRQQRQLTGPYSAKEIKDQAIEGLIVPETELCLGSGGAWMKAAKVKELVFAGQVVGNAVNPASESSAAIPVSEEVDYPPPPPLPPVELPVFPMVSEVQHLPDTTASLPAPIVAVDQQITPSLASEVGITVRQFLAGLGSCVGLGFIVYSRYNRWVYSNQQRQQKAATKSGVLQIRWCDVSDEGVNWLTAQERLALEKMARESGKDVHVLRIDLRNGGTLPVEFDPKWLKIEFGGKAYSFEPGTKESGLAATTIAPGTIYEAQGFVRLPFSAEYQQVILRYSQPGIEVQELK